MGSCIACCLLLPSPLPPFSSSPARITIIARLMRRDRLRYDLSLPLSISLSPLLRSLPALSLIALSASNRVTQPHKANQFSAAHSLAPRSLSLTLSCSSNGNCVPLCKRSLSCTRSLSLSCSPLRSLPERRGLNQSPLSLCSERERSRERALRRMAQGTHTYNKHTHTHTERERE